ncbi:LysR family transcriptional regulator [Hansschlegelia sp. KR7-227]|uniref:LysR family transcriptional regulator n=1 Tax=Hansschlegelia sp. KR7-227 TaxID=3400914 RepID=UPI003C055BD9
MNYTLRHLRYFVAAVEAGSISQAARDLNISQPSVSSAIDHLEREVGVELLLRKRPVGVLPTAAGRDLMRAARLLLNHAKEFDAAASSLSDAIAGEIHVACFVNIASVYLAAILRSFYERHPNVTVRCHVVDQGDIFEGIDSGLYETALTFDLNLTSDYSVDIVTELPPRLVVSHRHPLAQRATASLADVASETFIFLDLPHSRDYFLSLFHTLDMHPARLIPVASFETIRALAGNGLGYSLLNIETRTAMNYDGTQVRYVTLTDKLRPLRICLLTPSGSASRRAVRTFNDHVKSFFANLRLTR